MEILSDHQTGSRKEVRWVQPTALLKAKPLVQQRECHSDQSWGCHWGHSWAYRLVPPMVVQTARMSELRSEQQSGRLSDQR